MSSTKIVLLFIYIASCLSVIEGLGVKQPLIECDPGNIGIKQTECEGRNCAWDSVKRVCLLNMTYGVVDKNVSSTGQVLRLLQDKDPPFGGAFQSPFIHFDYINNNILRMQLDDKNTQRYKVPVPVTFQNRQIDGRKYRVNVTSERPFSFQIVRTDTNTVIWDTSVGGLVLSDQFLQIVTRLPTDRIYGLGENYHETFRHNLTKTWPVFNRDQPVSAQMGVNLFGTQPFYVCVDDRLGNSHGVLLMNSNAMEYSFSSAPTLTWRTIGGILDFYFFIGDSVEEVIRQYTQTVGKPILPPYWGLGYHLSRYGHRGTADIKHMLERVLKYNIPLDANYLDIDHLVHESAFTVDSYHFPGLNEYVHELQASGVKLVHMLDPCIITNMTDFQPYKDFKAAGANIRWPKDMTPPYGSADTDGSVLGWVWPDGKVIFPDFLNQKAGAVWKLNIKRHRKKLTFDGLWIDMNDPSNFDTNRKKAFNWPPEDKPYWTLKCPVSKWDDPPYRPLAARVYDYPGQTSRLSDKTVCMSLIQGDRGQYRHYDVHNLYAWAQSQYTISAIREATGTRGFLITRSTFPGTGQYAVHWLGDNASTWKDLRRSIIGMLEFNLFGFPFVGSDICGFMGDTNEELCLRWTQLGAFYTFSRNHNAINAIAQDPGAFGDEYARIVREILNVRYSLLPYLYSLFYEAHIHGGTVVRAPFYEFPEEDELYDVNYQFMWGAALLISPIVYEGQTSLEYFLPSGVWYNFYTWEKLEGPQKVTIKVERFTQPALNIRGGNVLLMQHPANNTKYSQKNPYVLLVALDENKESAGSMYLDDGISQDTYSKKEYMEVVYVVSNYSIVIKPVNQGYTGAHSLFYDTVVVLGLTDKRPGFVHITADGLKVTEFQQEFLEHSKVLRITDLKLSLVKQIKITFSPLSKDLSERLDCWPERAGQIDSPTELSCIRRNCAWKPQFGQPDVPPCYFLSSRFGFKFFGHFIETEPGTHIGMLQRKIKGPFNKDFEFIEIKIEERGKNLARITFDTVGAKRFRPPVDLNLKGKGKVSAPKYKIKLCNTSPCNVQIIRTKTGTIILEMDIESLIFEDQFIQISNKIPTKFVYGLGENIKHTFKRQFDFKTYAVFTGDNKDQGNLQSDGVHSFYVGLENDGNAHGALMLNSGAQDYMLCPSPSITYRVISGTLDFYVFLGPTPEDVVKQYHNLIGLPFMVPYWSLGFSVSVQGHIDVDRTRSELSKLKKMQIPLDMLQYDKTVLESQTSLKSSNESSFLKSLKTNGLRTIIKVVPAVPYPCKNGSLCWQLLAVNGSVRRFAGNNSASSGNTSLISSIPSVGKVIFPDFFKNITRHLITRHILLEYKDHLPFDGMNLDKNGPAPLDSTGFFSCPVNKWNDPPYRTASAFYFDNINGFGRVSDGKLCMSSLQGETDEYRTYNVAALYGLNHVKALHAVKSVEEHKERALMISQSTFVGSGRYTGHILPELNGWTGLQSLIVGMLDFNLFGIPYVGMDVSFACNNSQSLDLCGRALQLGALFGFSALKIGPNDVVSKILSDEDTKTFLRESLETRYSLLPYLYSLFYKSHVDGGTVFRALHHQFPTDMTARTISSQFMWGSSILVSPIIQKDILNMNYYLPGGAKDVHWYNFYTGILSTTKGKTWMSDMVKPTSKTFLHLKGGSIIPLQKSALNTTYSRESPMKLIAALDSDGLGVGELFYDDGISRDSIIDEKYILVQYHANSTSLVGKVAHNGIPLATVHLLYDVIEIWGVDSNVQNCYIIIDSMQRVKVNYQYNAANKKLWLQPKLLSVARNFELHCQ